MKTIAQPVRLAQFPLAPSNSIQRVDAMSERFDNYIRDFCIQWFTAHSKTKIAKSYKLIANVLKGTCTMSSPLKFGALVAVDVMRAAP